MPKRVGRYDAIRQIGAGATARVFLGVQADPPDLKRVVAIKQLHREIASDPAQVDTFRRNSQLAICLSHPNLARTNEALVEGPDYALIMEFVDGHPLRDVLQRLGRRSMPLHEHIWILTQLLSGLHYADQLCSVDSAPLGLVHRHVTSKKVLISNTGEVKVLGAFSRQSLGEAASTRSNTYAVGVMLWEAIARKPYEELPIERVCSSVPPPLAVIVQHALQADSKRRYQNAHEFQHALERFLVNEQSQACAESVSRLLRPYFERDRIERQHAVESYAGFSRRVRREKSDLTPEFVTLDEEEAQTSRIPVDRALLRASAAGPLHDRKDRLWEVLRGAWIRRQPVQRLLERWLRTLPNRVVAGLSLGTIAAIGLVAWFGSGSPEDPSTTSISPARSNSADASVAPTTSESEDVRVHALQLQPSAAPELLGQPPNPPAPAVQLMPDSPASAEPRSRQPVRLPRSRAQRTAFASRPLQRGGVEPGMDLPPLPRPRVDPNIDREDPYAP